MKITIDEKEKRAETIDRKTGQTISAIAEAHYSDVKHRDLFYSKFGEDLCGFSGIWIWIADAAIAFDQALEELKGFGSYRYYIDWLDEYCEIIKQDSMLETKEWASIGNMDDWFKARAIKAIDGRVQG